MAIATGTAIALGAATLGSAYLSSEASRKSANAIKDASGKATDAQLQMYFDQVERSAPWTEAGEEALSPLKRMAIEGPGEFRPEEQPGYKFGYKEFVEKPLLQRTSAMGKLRSGNTLRELSDRASDYASLSYDNWLNRWLTKMQPLQSLAGLGQTSNTAIGNQGIITGQGISQNTMTAGFAQGQNYLNQGNVGSNLLMSGSKNYLDWQAANKMGGGNSFNSGMTLKDPGAPSQGVYEGWTFQ